MVTSKVPANNCMKGDAMENNWKLHHICIVVRDMDKAIEYYQSLDIATIEREVTVGNRLKVRFVRIGATPLEFVQPLAEESNFKEFLESNGEGIHHICFVVDDIDKETAKLVEKGVSVTWSSETQTGFDTRKVGNLILELKQSQ